MKCKICGNDKNNNSFLIKEMQLGFFEEFEYVECSNCGCLQIKDVPKNMEKYYSGNYISHKTDDHNFLLKFADFKAWQYAFTGKSILGKISSYRPYVNPWIFGKVWRKYVGKNKDISILDVGCGKGEFLLNLKKVGYKDLQGIDLFIDENKIPKDINIIKEALDEYNPNKKFDIITSHHSFEHMDCPIENLNYIKNLLKDDGILFIRIPVKSDYIWNKYGINWYQIDAPRHIVLYTIESFTILADKVGFNIEDVVFDSFPSQFIMSNRYVKGISMFDEKYSFKEINNHSYRYYKKKTKKLNELNQGDQAIFILTKK